MTLPQEEVFNFISTLPHGNFSASSSTMGFPIIALLYNTEHLKFIISNLWYLLFAIGHNHTKSREPICTLTEFQCSTNKIVYHITLYYIHFKKKEVENN